jgi:hypothetical protein
VAAASEARDFRAIERDSPLRFGIAFSGVGGPLNAPAKIFFNLASLSSDAMAFDPQKHPAEYRPTMVSKLAAGKRQLDCAIEMWFQDKDQVAVHTLAVAAHQIIHDIHEKQFPDKPLFLNYPLVKEGFRAEFINIFKEASNFFKHADRDPNAGSIIEFSPFLTQIFFIYSIAGLSGLGEIRTDLQMAHQLWFGLHHGDLMSPEFIQAMNDGIPSKHLQTARSMKKREFLESVLEAQFRSRVGGI